MARKEATHKVQTARIPSAIKDIQTVRRSYGLDASQDEKYRHFFVRDAVTALEHLSGSYPEIAVRTFDHAIALQATRYNALTEGRRGRYPHEHATRFVDGKEVSQDMQRTIRMLSSDWGGTEEELLYYGSEDATPMVIVGMLQFYQEFGDWYKDNKVLNKDGTDFLDGKIITREGETITRRESIFRALEHLTDRINSPAEGYESIGLLSFKRINPKGHNNQTWMDSPASFMRPNGELPNYDGPIYAIELQGYAYDAYMYALDIWGKQEPEKAQIWKQMAQRIQRQTLDLLWMREDNFFAMGLDHDPITKTVRPIEVRSINVAELLKSRIFDNLLSEEQERYVGKSWERLMGPGFLTPVGLRCRDKEQGTPIGYEGYHNEHIVWIKASHNAARAGRKWGFIESAMQLGIRHINYVNVSGSNYEIAYVSDDDVVDYDPTGSKEITRGMVVEKVPVEHIPMITQTWTASSIFDDKKEVTRRALIAHYQHIMRTLDRKLLLRIASRGFPGQLQSIWDEALDTLDQDNRLPWVKAIDARVGSSIPQEKLLKSRRETVAAFPKGYAFILDRGEGARRRERVLERIYEERTAAHSF